MLKCQYCGKKNRSHREYCSECSGRIREGFDNDRVEPYKKIIDIRLFLFLP